jgi:hypothetical protein
VIAVSGHAAASVQRTAAVRPAAATYSTAGRLNGVAAASNSSAWAVGYAGKSSAPKILMLRWNGTAWSRVTSPGVLTATGQLSAVTVVSAKSAWAVGSTGEIGTGKNHSLLLHWNGSGWRQVTSPAPVPGGNLAAVTATAKSGWAVGYVNTDPSAPLCCAGTPLVFRWNGSKWSRVTTKLGKGTYLNGVASTAANTSWATGGPLAMITGALAKWSGGLWSWTADPVRGAFRPLNGISAGPGGTAFVVGTDNDSVPAAISARWTGKAWRQVAVSAPADSGLNAVAFAPGGTAWAAGSYFAGSAVRTLVMRWNGRAWTRVPSPGTGEELNGLAFSASNYGWAVGDTTSTSGNGRTVILHWNGAAWGLAAAASPAGVAGSATGAASPSPAAAYYTAPGSLTGVAAASASSAWAVGFAGSSAAPRVLMLHWNGRAWARVTSPGVLTGAGQLNAIKVVSAKDAWAVGFTGNPILTSEHTLLLHWNGGTWSVVTRPAPVPGFLNAVTASAKGGWAVGGVPNGHVFPHPLALRLSGATWSRVPVPNVIDVNGVAMTGANTAWAIGVNEQFSELAHWNGQKWTWALPIPLTQGTDILGGIAASPAGAAFAVGEEFPNGGAQVPSILRLAGSTWKKVTVRAPSNAGLHAVTFAPGGTPWAAGAAGSSTLILRWNGTAWTRVASPSPGTGDTLLGLGFSSARDGWAVGSSGSDTLILHWNGTRWTVPPLPPTGYKVAGALLGVAAASNSSAWAVGYAGGFTTAKVLMLHWTGAKWSRVTTPAVLTGPGQLAAITVVSASDAWAVGFTGTDISQHTLLMHWDGMAWSQVTSPAPIAGALSAVTATATGGWAVGDVHPGGAAFSPLILRLTGGTWSRPATTYGTHVNDDVALGGVAVNSASSAWAIGNTQATSALAHWSGGGWTSAYSQFPLSSGVYFFKGIAAGPGGAAFMVGARESGLSEVPFSAKLAGATWHKVAVGAPAGAGLNAVTFAPGGTAWAAGSDGSGTLILRWTGKAWTSIPGAIGTVSGLGFSAANYGWAVGATGSNTLVLHWNGGTWA